MPPYCLLQYIMKRDARRAYERERCGPSRRGSMLPEEPEQGEDQQQDGEGDDPRMPPRHPAEPSCGAPGEEPGPSDAGGLRPRSMHMARECDRCRSMSVIRLRRSAGGH